MLEFVLFLLLELKHLVLEQERFSSTTILVLVVVFLVLLVVLGQQTISGSYNK